MSQLHQVLLKAHNAFVDEARPKGTPDDKVFGRISDHSQLSEEVSGKIRRWLGVI
jgi:hypothetical protein